MYGNGYVVNRSISRTWLIWPTFFFSYYCWKKKLFFFYCLNKVQAAEADDRVWLQANVIMLYCLYTFALKFTKRNIILIVKREQCCEHREMKLISLLFLRLYIYIIFPRTRIIVKSLLFRTGTLNFDRYSVYKRDRYRFARNTHLQCDSMSRWRMDFTVRGYFI